MFGIKTAIINYYLNREKKELSEIKKLKLENARLKKVKVVFEPARSLFKSVAWAGITFLWKIFDTYRQSQKMSWHLTKYKQATKTAINEYFIKQYRWLSVFNKDGLLKLADLFFMFLESDNAYEQIFNFVLREYSKASKRGLI